MLLGEPQSSQYDWRFQIFGFPVRVTWLFWAVSAALGYGGALSLQAAYASRNIQVHLGVLLGIWVAVTFLSILVHELGHALAFRYFGIRSEIVLYQMGGLAIPGAGMLWGRNGRRTQLSHGDQIIISAAGPAIQLLLAALVGIGAILCGIRVNEFNWLSNSLKLDVSTPLNPAVYALVNFLVTSSIWWALINLLPIFPLDGGQIAQHIIGIFRRNSGLMEAHAIGAVVGFVVAYWFLTHEMPLNALFLASIAMNNIQAMQSGYGPRNW
jgi:stage IV sporulation protein FB